MSEAEAETTRISTLDELELSVHHTVGDGPRSHTTEYELHAGVTDVLYIPADLADALESITGVNLEHDEIQCGAAIEIVPTACENCGAAIDRPALVDYYGTETPACPACEALL